MDWSIETAIEYDSDTDSDDENELRQLDAVLEEAEIEICHGTPWHKSQRLVNSSSAFEHMTSSRASDSSYCAHLLETSVQAPTAETKTLEIPVSCENGSSSRSTSLSDTVVSPQPNPSLQEISKLDSLLMVNKMYEEKLRSLERILGVRLKECRTKLDAIQKSSALSDRVECFRYINCGRPYFRDNQNLAAPDNDDTIMAKAEMYDYSLLTSVSGWTVKDKNQFTSVMTKISLEMRQDDYNDKIRELKNSLLKNKNKKKKKMIENEIKELEKERDSLNSKMPFAKLALPLDREYDWDVLTDKLNKRHTPHEYRCLWKLYFHPSINKSTWTKAEHNILQTLALDHQHQDWDEIARKLNTGRTGYQCFVYYRTNMTSSCIGQKWSQEEVIYLKRLIEYFRDDYYIPWGKIAAAMENRTKIQIYNKYLRLVEQRKGRFLPEEDSVILNCVERFGPNFKKVNEYLAHRSMVQIRSRYQVLNKMKISTVWSVEDDRKLLQIMSNQDSKTTFSRATKFFPGKNRVNLRSRYMTLIKWMKRNPNADIELAPRRGARRLNHGHPTDNLNTALENLKNTLNTEVAIKKSRKKITRESDEPDIEDAIIAILVNERVKEQEQRKSTYEGLLVLPNETVVTDKELDLTNLQKCLIFLGSNINKTLFNNSQYKNDYPQLIECKNDINLIKVKSYSRRNTIKTILLKDNPDIWGNHVLTSRNFVLPPHYATITGCKALMSHVTAYAMYINSTNLHILVRRNSILKELMEQLLERFYILFLWPMLLSNEGPNDFNSSKLCKVDSYYDKRGKLPQTPEVTIKLNSLKKFNIKDTSEVIDLSEDDMRIEEITIPENLNEDDINDNIKNLMK